MLLLNGSGMSDDAHRPPNHPVLLVRPCARQIEGGHRIRCEGERLMPSPLVARDKLGCAPNRSPVTSRGLMRQGRRRSRARKSASSLHASAARTTASSDVTSISGTRARPWIETAMPRACRISRTISSRT